MTMKRNSQLSKAMAMDRITERSNLTVVGNGCSNSGSVGMEMTSTAMDNDD